MASVDLQEKANFTRLSRLLVDKGTEALRNTFDAIHPPANLPAVLAANRTSLLKLKFRVINNTQWDLLFPPSGNPPDSKTFDVTLLTVLFRNICALPSTGWSVMPPDMDKSMQANILRIKLFRNEVYAHVASTQVDNATFKSLWQKISQALVELNIPQSDVDDLKTCSLGSEEEVYVEILEEWKSQEEESMKVLTSIAEQNRELHQSILEQQSDIQALQSSVNHSSQVVKDIILEKTCSKESDEDLLQKLAKHNFKSKIRSKVKFCHPGTREWFLEEVERFFENEYDEFFQYEYDEFVENERESRMLLLTAGPGFGKSVFAAKVCEDFRKKGKFAACHFFDFSNSNLRDPMTMLQSLASQMCENIAGFKEKLLDQLRRPHQVRNLKDAFGIYLLNPLDELGLEKPSLVVIDGLDESEADDKNEIVNLIADYFPDLPECIKVLVTSRPEISVAKLSGVQKIDIANNDLFNKLDLQIYLKSCLPSVVARDIVVEALAEKCEGSFLYAFCVQSELRKRDDLDKMTYNEIINFLPDGLDSIYQKYFKRLEDELKATVHGNVDVLRVLEMLAASKGSLPLIFVTRALGLAPDCRETRKIINKVNETVSCLLYVSDDLVTVFHKSVIDWLLANGYEDHEYTVKASDGNKSLWLICEQVFEQIKKNICSEHDLNLTNDVKYALDHGLRHLEACNMEESFFWLVDFVIIHVLFTIYPQNGKTIVYHQIRDYLQYLSNRWQEILQGSVVTSDKLRELIIWHVLEIDFLRRRFITVELQYLQSVLTHSPKGYFSDSDKKIAELLYSKVSRFVEFNFKEVEVIPLAFWRRPTIGLYRFSPRSNIKAVGMSYDKTKAAIVKWDRTISVVCVPSLVELWQHSTRYKDMSCCTFAPDDSFVLFGKLETALNIAERKEMPFFYGNKETFMSCAFSPNGSRLATGDGSNTIKLWDVSKQSLLSLLCADVPVGWCSFSSTGLFIIADRKYAMDITNEDSESDSEDFNFLIGDRKSDSFCVWNAITWQRSDERNIRDVKLKEPGVFQNKKCKRCFRPGLKELNSSKRSEIELCMPSKFLGKRWKTWSTGIYNGVECSFFLKDHSLSVVESTHFTTLATWNLFVHFSREFETISKQCFSKITAIEDDLWFYADMEKIIVFRTLLPTQQKSRLATPTRVLSSSFSPDGSRLATCTSDGYINIWNAYTSQVQQHFKSNQGESSFACWWSEKFEYFERNQSKLPFACWWSEKFLFVFEFFDRIPSLSKYPVDVNLKILFSQSQEVSLYHLADDFVSLLAIFDFSEGLLIFECSETESLNVLDVNGVGGPRMVTLFGNGPVTSVTISSGGSFVFCDDDSYCIWQRNAEEEPAVYEILISMPVFLPDYDDALLDDDAFLSKVSKRCKRNVVCCFSNDSKVAVVLDRYNGQIIDLDGDDDKSVRFDGYIINSKLFCIMKDRIVIAASHHVIRFFDMDSGALLETSFQRYLTEDLFEQTKLSPKENMIAFPKINGDMEFLRLCVPPDPLLSSIKREAANILTEKRKSEMSNFDGYDCYSYDGDSYDDF